MGRGEGRGGEDASRTSGSIAGMSAVAAVGVKVVSDTYRTNSVVALARCDLFLVLVWFFVLFSGCFGRELPYKTSAKIANFGGVLIFFRASRIGGYVRALALPLASHPAYD